MSDLEQLLQQVQSGAVDIDEAANEIRGLITPQYRVADLGFARVDVDREKRTGFPEVIFGEGKTAEQIVMIAAKLKEQCDRVLATRIDADKAKHVMEQIEGMTYHPTAKILTWFKRPIYRVYDGYVAVVCAGTSDIPIAEEAAITVECSGSHVERIYDVGVAGIHRLFEKLPTIREANAIVVVAGMEGALPSVLGGLVDKPIVAVPSSIGYGAGFQGIAALLAMLNACSPGIAVMNIDNGFGAGYYAGLINKNRLKRDER